MADPGILWLLYCLYVITMNHAGHSVILLHQKLGRNPFALGAVVGLMQQHACQLPAVVQLAAYCCRLVTSGGG